MNNLKYKNKFIILIKTFKNILLFLVLFLIILICIFLIWFKKNFSDFGLNEIIFYTINLKQIEKKFYVIFLKAILIPSIFITILFWFLNSKIYNNIIKNKKIILNIKKFSIKNNIKLLERKKDYIFIFKIFKKQLSISMKRKLILIFLINFYLIISFFFILNLTKNIIKPLNLINKTKINDYDFFKENYINPKNVELNFPKKKQNLIYIFAESLESTFFSKNLDGIEKQNILDPITNISKEGINFSNTENFGGAYSVFGTNFPTAGIVAQTLAIPLNFETNIKHTKKLNNNFLKNFYGLGNILKKEGYFQMFLIGSNKEFDNLNILIKNHGNYETFKFEDEKLFEIAKEKLKKIENKKQPFNLTILTTNTNFSDKFVKKNYENKSKEKYFNNLHNSCVKINNFIEWIKKQKFYKNTTIIISGNHLNINTKYFSKINKSFKRTIYNVFLNSKIKPLKSKNRSFTTLDMLPSTLSSLGVKIKGEKLGLGVNLFSNEKTLAEKYGIPHLNDKLKEKSKFYESLFYN